MSSHLQYHPSYLKDHPMNPSLQFFFDHLKPEPRVLELGTKRSIPSRPTHHEALFPRATSFVKSDFEPGLDVDVVADIHCLSTDLRGMAKFDAIFCASVFEHLHSPWVAAEEILKMLNPGGVFLVQTHLCFPEHGYPHDYFRFTRMGLERIFQGSSQVVSCYDFAATLTPNDRSVDWNPAAPNWLNVNIGGLK